MLLKRIFKLIPVSNYKFCDNNGSDSKYVLKNKIFCCILLKKYQVNSHPYHLILDFYTHHKHNVNFQT